MAETFHPFPDLPKELRLQIWEQAMIEARPNRRILIYKRRVVPFKHLVSPLLLVNHESRTCARDFYNVKLDVHAVPPITWDQVKHLNKQEQWGRIEGSEWAVDGVIHGYTDERVRSGFQRERMDLLLGICEEDVDVDEALEANDNEEKNYCIDLKQHWSDFVRDELRVLGANSVRGLDSSAPTAGVFYISPEHDVFVTDYDCGWYFCIDNAQKLLGIDFPSIRGTACNHISAKLSGATRQRISTLVLVRISSSSVSSGITRDCVFSDEGIVIFDRGLTSLTDYLSHADTLRTSKTFPGVREYFALRWSGLDPWHNFMEDLNDPNDAKLSEYLVHWANQEQRAGQVSSTDERGRVMLTLEIKEGHRNGLEKADWVRDMMSHWKLPLEL